MPNINNVESPVVIVGAGRSGTSLLSALFERHPDFSYEGEVANLIFGVWSSVENALNGMPELTENGHLVSPDERAGRAVRNTFLSLGPNPRKNWCIKPIGIPRAVSDNFPGEDDWDQAAVYYWKALGASFPKARYIAVLRHPCDVVISSCSRWGHDPKTIWWSLGFMAHILAHECAPKIQVISFDDLVGKGEKVTRELLAALQIDFYPEVLGAFAERHATLRELSEVQAKKGSRRDHWQSMVPGDLLPKYRSALDRLYRRFGHPAIAWPKHFDRPAKPKPDAVGTIAATETKEAEIGRHLAAIATLNRAVDKANVRCQSLLLEQSRSFDQIWREKENYIRSLSEAVTWHEKEYSLLTRELESTQAKLVEATQWFDAQAAEAKTERESLEKFVTELRGWNEVLVEAKDWNATQIGNLTAQLQEATRLAAEEKAWHEQQLADAQAAANALRTESQQLRDWNAELVKAKDWHASQIDTLAAQLQDAQRLLLEQQQRNAAPPDDSRAVISQLREWNEKLIEAKEWHTAQMATLTYQLQEASRLAAEQKHWHEQQLAHAQAAAAALRVESEQLREWNAELIKAKDWHAAQSETLATQLKEAQRLQLEQKLWSDRQLADSPAVIQQLREWNDKLVEAKDWHTAQLATLTTQMEDAIRLAAEKELWTGQQLANAQAAAEAFRAESQQLREWNAELVKAKDWHGSQIESLATQLAAAQRLHLEQKQRSDAQLTESHAVIQQLREWNDKLVEAKDWHTAQLATLAAQLKESAQLADDQKRWNEQQLANTQAATDALRAEARQLREWNAELVKAKDWQAAQVEALAAKCTEADRLFRELIQWSETQIASQRTAAGMLHSELEKLRDWNGKLAEAKDWQVAQNDTLATQLKEATRLAEEGNRWNEQQLANAQAAAAALRAEAQQLREWNTELVKAKDWQAAQNDILAAQLKEAAGLAEERNLWNEQQLANAQAAAVACHAECEKLRDWNAELVKAKDWQAAQVESLAAKCAEADRLFHELKQWSETQNDSQRTAAEALLGELQKLRDWNDKLTEAKDWQAAQSAALVERIKAADKIFREQQDWIAVLEAAKK